MNTPFHDLDRYIELPRLSGLALSPDGTRLVTAVSALNKERTGYISSLWEIDPAGQTPARRLTHGAHGESNPTFTNDGDLLFTSKREGQEKAALWCLPAEGGEAALIAELPGGIESVIAAERASKVVVKSDVHLKAKSLDADARIRETRAENKVDAILHSSYPIRYWDRDLGPDYPRLFAFKKNVAAASVKEVQTSSLSFDNLLDLTPQAGVTLSNSEASMSADGAIVVTSQIRFKERADHTTVLTRIDAESGEHTVLFDEQEASHPVISPNGQHVAFLVTTPMNPHTAPDVEVWIVGIDGSNPRNLSGSWDRHANEIVWLPDSTGLLLSADDDGRAPIFRLTLDGVLRQVTIDPAAFTNLTCSTPTRAYALMSSYAHPNEVVSIDLHTGQVESLLNPHERPQLPGQLREVETEAEDGTRIRSWLALPQGEGPAPLLLWIHGGPVASWNAWSWRWNPWLAVAQGYAVLLPDPGLSTGYGQEFIQRGWGSWGGKPYTDLMAAVDGVSSLPEIDAERMGAMGGSFGGYMANWIAGHTDRFNAIVTHASLWNLFTFGATTDDSNYWAKEMTAAMVAENSPHTHVAQIRTPMLVIHGDKDYRVPIGEGVALWYQLLAESGRPAREDGTSDHQFLYFPNENHWVLSPQHAKLWYETVFDFLKTWV